MGELLKERLWGCGFLIEAYGAAVEGLLAGYWIFDFGCWYLGKLRSGRRTVEGMVRWVLTNDGGVRLRMVVDFRIEIIEKE